MADLEKTGHSPPMYDEKDISKVSTDEQGTSGRKDSVVNEAVLTGEIYDERYESTQRGLKSRHAQMIALGGTIGTLPPPKSHSLLLTIRSGTGLFVGSGQTLATGGPAFILASYSFIAFLVWCVVTGITEVAAYLPTKGSSMSMFGWRYVSRSLGFAMGWLYWYSLGILVPYEVRFPFLQSARSSSN